jgi:hypothetical protein
MTKTTAVQVVAKLTLVSVTVNGRRVSEFVRAECTEGKARISATFIQEMAARAGAARGSTISLGA